MISGMPWSMQAEMRCVPMRPLVLRPQMKKLAESDASEPLDADAAGFTRYVAAEVARWGELVRTLDIKGEE